jgi:hypothetical protein
VSEGHPENWAAVARAISDRVRELGWRQRELAERSHVSAAVVRAAVVGPLKPCPWRLAGSRAILIWYLRICSLTRGSIPQSTGMPCGHA